MTRPGRPTPGPDRRGRASGAAVSAGRKQAKRAAEGAVAASTGGTSKVALALLPSPLDSPEEKAKKKRRRRIIYAVIAALLIAQIVFVFTIVSVVSSAVLGSIATSSAPINAGQCVEVNARGDRPDAPRPTRGNGQMGYPVDPDVPETSGFGPRWGAFHDGLDFGGPLGTPIYAVADGVVKEAGPADGYGNWIILEHEIDGEIVDTLYGHMQSNGVHVQAGDEVEAGQHIADIGNEGFSTGAHLHFGVYPGGWAQGAGVDPKPWLDRLREQSPDEDEDDEEPDSRSQQVSNRQDSGAEDQPAGTVTAADWDKLAQCESGGNWATDTGNGYSGGLQFAPETWAGFGGTEYAPTAGEATREQQMEIANKVLAEQGWSAWPACTNGTYPELKDLDPAPPGTFVSDRDDANQGGDFEDGLALIVDQAKDAGVTVGVSVVPARGGETITAGSANASAYSASTIKVAVAAAVERNLRQDEEVTVRPEHVVGGAGIGLSAGDYPASRLQEVMITDSDNTATNALIDAVGGFDEVNAVISAAGVSDGLSLQNMMMSGSTSSQLSATGATEFLIAVWGASTSGGGFITNEGANRIIDLMKAQSLRSKLPAHIPQGEVANKTGENAGVSHDIGYIWPDSGPPVAVAVTSTFNGGDSAAVSAVADIGKHIYYNFDGSAQAGSSRQAGGGELPKTPAEIGSEDRLQVDAVRGMRTVVEQFPEVNSIGGWREDGGGSTDHPSGRAIDAMVPMDEEGKELGDRIADYFIENAEELNVVSVIWQQRYWEGGEWSDMADEGDPTENHMDHVHVSFQGNGAPNADTTYESLGGEQDESDRSSSARFSDSDDELMSMNLTPEQQVTVKAIIVQAKDSDLGNQEQAATLAAMLSGHQANFINMDAEDNVNKVGIFAQAPFAGTSQQQLMDPMRVAGEFMDRLEEVAEDRPGWADEPGQDVLIEMYPERAALKQELERWEPLAAGVVGDLWDDENAQAGSRLERLPDEQEACRVGAGQALDDGTVPPEFVKWIELGAQVCEDVDAPLLAAQLDAESGFDPNAESGVGAQGPAQFMPYTWPQWGSPRDENGEPIGPTGTGDPFKISDAVMAQADFMCGLSEQIGGWIDDGTVQGDRLELMLAGYNAGPGAVLNAGGMPSGGDYTIQTQPYVAKIMAGREKFAKAGSGRSERPSRSRAASRGDIGAQALEAARAYEGVPYVWGGKDPAGLDCSGLISIAFRDIGYIVPHGTKAQVEVGQEVSVEEAEPGDVVFSRFEGNGPEHVAFVAEPGESYYEAQMSGVPVGEFQRWADDSVIMRYTADDLDPVPGAD